MRNIGVISVGRSDYGIYLPVLRAIQASDRLSVLLFAAGAHWDAKFGSTAKAMTRDGFTPIPVPFARKGDADQDVAATMGEAVSAFAQALARRRPDLLLVLGDRFDMFAAAAAAVPLGIPLVHLHGGEISEGAMDDQFRHAITKLSHLHCVAAESFRRRLVQMGEQPWRITVCGAPGLDLLNSMALPDRASLSRELNFPLDPAPLMVTFHPVTRQWRETGRHIQELLSALDEIALPVVLTYPNQDMGADAIIEAIEAYARTRSSILLVKHLGARAYFGLMQCAAAMAGNSSSGLIEAASFGLPVVNIGDRQKGRFHGANVIDAICARADIVVALRQALTPAFRTALAGMDNPYGDGKAAQRIVHVLETAALDRNLLWKRFHDLPFDDRLLCVE